MSHARAPPSVARSPRAFTERSGTSAAVRACEVSHANSLIITRPLRPHARRGVRRYVYAHPAGSTGSLLDRSARRELSPTRRSAYRRCIDVGNVGRGIPEGRTRGRAEPPTKHDGESRRERRFRGRESTSTYLGGHRLQVHQRLKRVRRHSEGLGTVPGASSEALPTHDRWTWHGSCFVARHDQARG